MVPILAITLSPLFLFTVVATLVAAAGLGYFLFGKKQDLDERRKAADELADDLKANGFTLIAGVLDPYSRGDYDEALNATVVARQIMKNPVTRKAHLQELCLTLAKKQCEDDETFADKLLEEGEFFRIRRRNKQEAIAEIEAAKREIAAKKATAEFGLTAPAAKAGK